MDFEFKFEGRGGLPSLIFNENKGTIKIYGKSLVMVKENFYLPLFKKLDEYLSFPRDIELTIDLEFFNTLSAKYLLELFYLIEEKQIKNNKDFIVKWMYEDEDIKDSGENYSKMIKYAEFELIKKN